jgi:hypothetical protein
MFLAPGAVEEEMVGTRATLPSHTSALLADQASRNSMPTTPRTDFSIHRQRLRTLTPNPLSPSHTDNRNHV